MYGILIGMDSSDDPPVVSRQVLRAYLVTITREQSWGPPIPLEAALPTVEWLADVFGVLDENADVTNRLIGLCREVPAHGKTIHDANIVATMLTYGESRILTFDTDDFQRYADRGLIALV